MDFVEVCSYFIIDILLLAAVVATGVAAALTIDKVRKKRKAAKHKDCGCEFCGTDEPHDTDVPKGADGAKGE